MKICIDAGHRNNVNDFGASGNGHKESALALQICKQLQTQFTKLGHTVVMTRESESTTISVDGRPRKAKQNGCDWLISIHLNAAGTPQAHGVEVLYKTQKNTATIVSAKLAKATGFSNRGAKQRNDLGVLNGFGNAILVECGFISNPQEAKQLATPSFQALVAKAIVEGFLEAQGITPTDSKLATAVAQRFGFNNATMQYLSGYKFADAMFEAFLSGRPVSGATEAYIKAYKFGDAVFEKVYEGRL